MRENKISRPVFLVQFELFCNIQPTQSENRYHTHIHNHTDLMHARISAPISWSSKRYTNTQTHTQKDTNNS